MKHKTSLNQAKYLLIAAGLALCATAALRFSFLIWCGFCIASNTFFAAWLTWNTSSKTVKKKDLLGFGEEEAPMEITVLRVPLFPLITALIAAIVTVLITDNAFDALLIFLAWGGIGFPLGLCVLRRSEFPLSMMSGLIWGSVAALIAGAAQVLILSPGFSFQLQYCLDLLSSQTTNWVTDLLQAVQSVEVPQEFSGMIQSLSELFPTDLLAEQIAMSILRTVPAVYAVGILILCCACWFSLKKVLMRSDVDIKYMGRLDGYSASRAASGVFLIAALLRLFSSSRSVMYIACSNVLTVLSAVLAFAGFSLILYYLNIRVASKPVRILLILLALGAGLFFGSWLFTVLGLLTAGRNTRSGLGGTLR